jgi:hypothetical protein
MLILEYQTRPILELLNVIKMPQPVIKEPISSRDSQKKAQSLAGCPRPVADGVQKELYQVVLNMRVSVLLSRTQIRIDHVHSVKLMKFEIIGGIFKGINHGHDRRSSI